MATILLDVRSEAVHDGKSLILMGLGHRKTQLQVLDVDFNIIWVRILLPRYDYIKMFTFTEISGA